MYQENFYSFISSYVLAEIEVGTHLYWEVLGLKIHGQTILMSWFVIFVLLTFAIVGQILSVIILTIFFNTVHTLKKTFKNEKKSRTQEFKENSEERMKEAVNSQEKEKTKKKFFFGTRPLGF